MGRHLGTTRRSLREHAVRMVAEARPDYPSDRSPICMVASRLGIGSAETLRKWVRQAEVDARQRPGVITASTGPQGLALAV